MKKNEISLLSKKFKSIELLNSEGCILKAFKTQEGFMMLDEHRELIGILSDKQIFKYTRGDLDLIDSEGRNLNYSQYPGSMKPNLEKLDEFIGVDTSGMTY
jgi:hypothetical protein